MRALGIIPARYASSRFPGKPLVMINGMSMIKRVYLQATQSKNIEKTIIATDDERIYNHAKTFTQNVFITSGRHVSGTDRCAEALMKEGSSWDSVINIQGDEPYIDPGQIDLVCSCLTGDTDIATLVKKITNTDDLMNENIPKVVIDSSGKALYFSRQPIPYMKGYPKNEWIQHASYLRHIGIYGFKAAILPLLTQLSPGSLEKAESLEQLRWLEKGYRIQTALTDVETIAIDTPEDLNRLLSKM